VPTIQRFEEKADPIRSNPKKKDQLQNRWKLACVPAAAANLATAGVAQQVLTESGTISGVSASGLSVYKGVPFAAPPVGDLRWRPPAHAAPWIGTRKADAFAPACMQVGVSMPGETPPVVSEDCLYLNIWTPAKNAQEHLPVIVWIYGGGYINGSSSMPLYWGDRLAHKGVIVVTIAYRLGPLGFLALPELTRESPHHSSGNYGLMDQIAALEWVHRNIAAFGGDPKCVTIAGQSSGSISVSILMASPPAKGLFQRAIGESGGLFEPLQLGPKFLLANAEHDGEKYAVSLGAASPKELRRLPASLLTGNAGGIVHPVIEPYVLPVSPYEAFASGQQNDVPLLIGSNADEARAMVNVTHETAATFDTDLEHSVGQLPPALVAAYPTRLTKRRGRRNSASSATSASAGTCGPGRGCKPGPERVLSFTTHFDSSHRSRPAPCTRVGARATSPSCGMSSTTWTSRLGTGPRQIGSWLKKCPVTGLTSRGRAIQTARDFPRGLRSPTPRARSNISPIRSALAALRISMD
jgi:para-nitrobenzyl esterase